MHYMRGSTAARYSSLYIIHLYGLRAGYGENQHEGSGVPSVYRQIESDQGNKNLIMNQAGSKSVWFFVVQWREQEVAEDESTKNAAV